MGWVPRIERVSSIASPLQGLEMSFGVRDPLPLDPSQPVSRRDPSAPEGDPHGGLIRLPWREKNAQGVVVAVGQGSKVGLG